MFVHTYVHVSSIHVHMYLLSAFYICVLLSSIYACMYLQYMRTHIFNICVHASSIHVCTHFQYMLTRIFNTCVHASSIYVSVRPATHARKTLVAQHAKNTHTKKKKNETNNSKTQALHIYQKRLRQRAPRCSAQARRCCHTRVCSCMLLRMGSRGKSMTFELPLGNVRAVMSIPPRAVTVHL